MSTPNRSSGFTLLELLLAGLMMALLATIAVPSYKTYMLRSNRAVGQGMLSNLVIQQELQFLRSGRYASDFSMVLGSDNSNADYFFLSRSGQIAKALNGNGASIYKVELLDASATAFVLSATTIGDQAKDKDCAVLMLVSSGQKTASASQDGDASNCWR